MKLAMTSIAVTASVCANASEADFLVASFMPFSLDLGMSHRCLRRPEAGAQALNTRDSASRNLLPAYTNRLRAGQIAAVLLVDFDTVDIR